MALVILRLAALTTLLLCLAAPPPAPVFAATRSEARDLYHRAVLLLERNTIESRRFAIQDLEQATLLEPNNPEYQITLARAYYQAGFLKNARKRFEHVVRMNPRDAQGRFGLGQVWRRDWLKYLDRSSLARAVENLGECTRIDPTAVDAWLLMTPLLMEQQQTARAAAVALGALAADPGRADALLAVAYTSYHLGQIARAESAFTAAIPRLARVARERFEDISPVATEQDTILLHGLPAAQQEEFVRRFWKDIDPDLGTAVNEAQLEYWSRVAHAYFLYFNTRWREWDLRGEVYVRYGPPGRTDYNPVGSNLYGWGGSPRNLLLWEYPDLGMRVVLEDRLLSEFYLLPMSRDRSMDPQPDPDSLARRDDALATRQGRGVFHKLPPGVKPLPAEGAIARFPGERGIRLLGQIETTGGPADSLWGEWVVLDSTRREVARGARALTASACDATGRRVADFAADLPPGIYDVGITVRSEAGGRGVHRARVHLPESDPALLLSDVVVCCGAPDVRALPGSAPVVRIAPNPGARVNAGDPLTAYFEITHLRPANDGQARFEYVYTVKSTEKDERVWLKRLLAPRAQIPSISASREEEHAGPIRRQFVSVPIQTLPPGKYKLEILVRDLVAGSEAMRAAEFVKLGAVAMRN